MGDVVEVLHADDGRDRLRLGDLLGGDGADAEVPDQPVLLHLRERGELLLDGAGLGAVEGAEAEVDGVEHVEAEVAEVVVDRLAQLLGRSCVRPAALGVPPCPHLGHDPQLLGVWVQRFPDDLVGDVRAVEVAGVDVRDAHLSDLAQHGDGFAAIFGRAEHAGS